MDGGKNLIKDGRFTAGDLSVWNQIYSEGQEQAWSKESGTGEGGSLYLKNTPDKFTNQGVGQYIELKGEAVYRISAKIKGDFRKTSRNGNTGAIISFGDEYRLSFGLENAGVYDWTEVSHDYTAPFSGKFKLQLRLWGSEGEVWFDDVSVVQIADKDERLAALWTKVPTLEDGYTFIAIPDTQMLCSYYPERNEAISRWIAENREKLDIKFAMHLGDAVDVESDAEQWARAKKAMEILDGKVPYALAIGNHDYRGMVGYKTDNSYVRNTEAYNKTFPLEKYKGGTLSGWFEDGKIDNTYHLTEFYGKKYLFLALEFLPRDCVLAWANSVAEKFSDREIIVLTHSHIDGRGVYDKWGKDYMADCNDGQEVFDKFLSRHKNISLIVNGHFEQDGYCLRIDKGAQGNKIYQVFANAQSMLSGGEAMVLIIRVTPGGFKFHYYSPLRDCCYTANKITDNTKDSF